MTLVERIEILECDILATIDHLNENWHVGGSDLAKLKDELFKKRLKLQSLRAQLERELDLIAS
jgi:hypothetical protein